MQVPIDRYTRVDRVKDGFLSEAKNVEVERGSKRSSSTGKVLSFHTFLLLV